MTDHDSDEAWTGRRMTTDGWSRWRKLGKLDGVGSVEMVTSRHREMSRQGFRLEDEGIKAGIMADHFGTRCSCDASLDRRRLSIWASISGKLAVRKRA